MATDRAILKLHHAGALASTAASDPVGELASVHSRSRDIAKTGTENAATNVAETVGFVVNRASRVKTVKYLTGTNVAADTSDYILFTLSKRTAGGSATTVATYNSYTGVQGAMTAYVPASFSVRTNSDANLAASDVVTYTLTKYGSGKAVAVGTITVDLEEV